jgi:hypothetical protein
MKNPIANFGILPVDFSIVSNVLDGYRSPKDKVSALEKRGTLLRLKKGLFVAAPEKDGPPLSLGLIANHLLGPSYVSRESALAIHGLIPEAVHVTRSMCLKRSHEFRTPLGLFDYTRVTPDYFSIGIRQHDAGGGLTYWLASPEKAICDMIVSAPRLRLQSSKAVREYLEEDLRIDLSEIEHFDTGVVRECAAVGKKKNDLLQLLQFFQRFQS